MKLSLFGVLLVAAALPSLSGQGTWTYNFITGGIDTNYWSTVNAWGTFTFTPSGSGVTVAGGNGSFQTAKLSLNLAQFPALTDFSISATLIGASFSGGVHQVQLEVNNSTAGTLLDRSYQSSDGVLGAHTVNVYDGSAWGFTSVPDGASGVSSPGTLGITRTGATYAFYWNGSYLYSKDYTSNPLTSVYLALNNNFGATDATSVTWQTFSITSSAIPEPATCAALAGLGACLAVAWRRRALGFAAWRKRRLGR